MKKHLYEIDLMRACIIFGVVCVHTISFLNTFEPSLSPRNIAFGYLLSALHFTRESFMFITGIVLFITYYRKPFKATTFWKKRFLLIAIPYITWTALYIAFSSTYVKADQGTFGHYLALLGTALISGNQFFMYFLVVSMQLYVLLPLFIAAMRKIQRGHMWIFIGSFLLQLVLMEMNRKYLDPIPVSHVPQYIRWLFQYRFEFILTYQFWFVSGAILAIHYEKVKAYILSHSKWVYGVFLLGLAALWVHAYIDRLVFHESFEQTVEVLQPMMIPYGLLITVVIWLLGCRWANVREHANMALFSRIIEFLGGVSFGIFLFHPIALHYFEVFIYHSHLSANVRTWLIPIFIAAVYIASGLSTWVLGKVPYVSYIVGKKKKLSWNGLQKPRITAS